MKSILHKMQETQLCQKWIRNPVLFVNGYLNDKKLYYGHQRKENVL